MNTVTKKRAWIGEKEKENLKSDRTGLGISPNLRTGVAGGKKVCI